MNQERTVNIEIGSEEWEGIYSNFVIITHSPSEFILDFARMLPGAKKAKVFSRIIMTPQNARALLATLDNNIQKFESEHGKIPVLKMDSNQVPIGFQTDPEPHKKIKH
jgi:hypothetical protein